MAPLKVLAAAVALLGATPAAADPLAAWSGFIAEASARFGVPEAWIRRVMRAESGGRTRRDGKPIVSRKGAMGLMQLMPRTWREMRGLLHLGGNPHDPHDNILAGTFYLRTMYDRFGYPGLFAAYNAGPLRYSASLATGRALPAETVAYVAQVSGEGRLRSALPVSAGLFAVRAEAAPAPQPNGAPPPGVRAEAPASAPRGLFVTLARTAR